MEKLFKIHLYYAIVAIVLLILIAYVSLLPGEEIPKVGIKNVDKLVHAVMYFILSSFMLLGFGNLKHRSIFVKSIPILVSFFCSFLIELLQEYTTSTRLFEIFDILANGIGCVIAFIVMKKQIFNKIKYNI